MPKDTFFNLSNKKRQRIISIAIDEFSSKGYDQSTISAIVKKANIAKGSFYHYFSDKRDLFTYIIDIITKEKLDFMSPVIENPYEHDFFEVLREMYLSALKFGAKRPKLLRIAEEINHNKNNPLYKSFFESSKKQGIEIFKGLLEKEISKGNINSNINIHFTAFLILNLGMQLNDYYFNYLVDETLNYDDYSHVIIELIDQQIELLKHGLLAKRD